MDGSQDFASQLVKSTVQAQRLSCRLSRLPEHLQRPLRWDVSMKDFKARGPPLDSIVYLIKEEFEREPLIGYKSFET